jgi:plasmid stabilization system protein ParE
MPYHYIFQEAAQKEYEDSVQWYAQRSILAAENFVAAVEEALFSICEYPHMWRNAYENYHELGLKKYPYKIIYTIEAKRKLVFIHALYHHKRDPKNKYPNKP